MEYSPFFGMNVLIAKPFLIQVYSFLAFLVVYSVLFLFVWLFGGGKDA